MILTTGSDIIWYQLILSSKEGAHMTFDEFLIAVFLYMAQQGMLDDMIEKYGNDEEQEK